MDPEICKKRNCCALKMTKTRNGFMFRCMGTPRNQTVKNVVQCERTGPLDTFDPKLALKQ